MRACSATRRARSPPHVAHRLCAALLAAAAEDHGARLHAAEICRAIAPLYLYRAMEAEAAAVAAGVAVVVAAAREEERAVAVAAAEEAVAAAEEAAAAVAAAGEEERAAAVVAAERRKWWRLHAAFSLSHTYRSA